MSLFSRLFGHAPEVDPNLKAAIDSQADTSQAVLEHVAKVLTQKDRLLAAYALAEQRRKDRTQ